MNYKRIAILLFSVSVVLASVSIASSELKIATYGLIHSFPPTFFAALFLLTLSFLITLKFSPGNKAFLFLHVVALILFLYFLPALVEKTPRFAPANAGYGGTDYTIRHGHVGLGSYFQCWPGLHYLGATMVEVTHLNPVALLMGFPIVFELICLPILYLILNRVSEDKRIVWIGLWLYYVAGWINRAYYSAQAYGFLLFLLITMVMLSSVLRRNRTLSIERNAVPLILIILFLAIAIGHLLSSIVAAIGLVILYILLRLFKIEGTRRLGLVIAALFAIALVALFASPIGDWFFKGFLPEAGERWEMFNLGAVFRATFQLPFAGGAEHAKVMYLRAIYTAIFCALALLGLLHATIKKKKHFSSVAMLGLLLGACSIIVLLGGYEGEIAYRAFEFSLLFLAFFAAKNYLNGKVFATLLVVFLIVSPVLFVASAYGNEKADYMSPAEIKGAEFFYDHAPDNGKVYSLAYRVWRFRYAEHDYWRELNSVSIRPFIEGSVDNARSDSHYVLVGERDIEACIFLGGDVCVEGMDQIAKSPHCAKVYSSDGFDLFYRKGL